MLAVLKFLTIEVIMEFKRMDNKIVIKSFKQLEIDRLWEKFIEFNFFSSPDDAGRNWGYDMKPDYDSVGCCPVDLCTREERLAAIHG